MSDTTEEGMIKPQKPPPKRPGRKKVAQKNLARRPKERGKYQPKHDQSASAKELVKDVAEYIFSDKEERSNYLGDMWGTDSDASSINQQSLEISEVDSASDRHESSSSVSTVFESDSSTIKSRPSSSTSRPESALETTSTFDSSAVKPVLAEPEVFDTVSSSPNINPPTELISHGFERLQSLLPPLWTVIAEKDGFHLLLLSSKCPQAIQREVFVSYGGNVLVYVHCVVIPRFKTLFELLSTPSLPFIERCLEDFCQFCVTIVKKFRQYEVCVGADDSETRSMWSEIEGGVIDLNPYQEESYKETFRSESCLMLVPEFKAKRCKSCSALLRKIAKRKDFLLAPSADPATANKNLTRQQASVKLELQEKAIRKKDKQIAWLRKRYTEILETEGCNLDEEWQQMFSKKKLCI